MVRFDDFDEIAYQKEEVKCCKGLRTKCVFATFAGLRSLSVPSSASQTLGFWTF
jgi:hypothetical protein